MYTIQQHILVAGVIAHEGFEARFFGHHASGTDPFCKFDDHMLQLFTSCLFLAGAAAAMVGSWTCKRYGCCWLELSLLQGQLALQLC